MKTWKNSTVADVRSRQQPGRRALPLGGTAGAFLAATAAAILSLLTSACSDNSSPATTPPVKQLNELSSEQLRVFLKGFPGNWRSDSGHAQSKPQPPRQKSIDPAAKRVALTREIEDSLGGMPLKEAIAARRSLRSFSKNPLTLQDLGFLLWATQGVTAISGEGDDQLELRASPSAGALYPIETHLLVSHVEGLTPGIYRYLPSSHELLVIKEDPEIARRIQEACYGETLIGQAPVVFAWTAVPARTEWKYAYLSARLIAVEVGHICENLYLAAQSIGAGACAVMGYDQARTDALLGVDSNEEFTLYVAAAGKAETESKGQTRGGLDAREKHFLVGRAPSN